MIYFPVLISFLVKIKGSDSIQALCPSSGCSSSTALPHLPPSLVRPTGNTGHPHLKAETSYLNGNDSSPSVMWHVNTSHRLTS